MTPEEIHVKQTEACVVALRREGKCSKDDYDWFRGAFLNQKKELARKSRHE